MCEIITNSIAEDDPRFGSICYDPADLLDDSPSVCLDCRHIMPAIPAIYYVFLDCKHLFYVGQTRNLWGRWRSHELTRFLRHESDRFRISWHRCWPEDLNLFEKYAVGWFAPHLNLYLNEKRYRRNKYTRRMEVVDLWVSDDEVDVENYFEEMLRADQTNTPTPAEEKS